MASASLLKSSPVLDKPEFVKGQPLLRQPAVLAIRSHSLPSSLTIRASSYADELVKTAVRFIIYITLNSLLSRGHMFISLSLVCGLMSDSYLRSIAVMINLCTTSLECPTYEFSGLDRITVNCSS